MGIGAPIVSALSPRTGRVLDYDALVAKVRVEACHRSPTTHSLASGLPFESRIHRTLFDATISIALINLSLPASLLRGRELCD